jgi:hypothetical protein
MFHVFTTKLIFTLNWQVMRMSTPHTTPSAVKERKVSQSASCKIDSIVRQLFLPMLCMPTPERTSFLAEDAEDQLLRQVAQERPGVLATEGEFVDYMVLLYRKFQRESSASDLIHSGSMESSVGAAVSAAVSMIADDSESHDSKYVSASSSLAFGESVQDLPAETTDMISLNTGLVVDELQQCYHDRFDEAGESEYV